MAESIGPFEIRGQLGRGAMAVVWRAYDPTLEREVALKEAMVPAGLSGDVAAEMAERFVREAKAAAKLNHPGIVTIYNAEVYAGRPVIVMEIIPGETLSDLLDRGPLDERTTASILDQLLDAAGYAHERGIVHRDIKPDNVFVMPDGRVKLADFGVAHVDSSSTLTQAGTVIGTPGYMAPEQITGSRVDARTDLFAVGVIGYEMLTGSNPFGATDGVTPTAVMYHIVQTDVPDAAEAVRGTTSHLSETLRVAMAKDPDFRFPDAAAMRDALRGGPILVAASAAGGAPRTATSLPGAAAGRPDGGLSQSTMILIGVGVIGVIAVVFALMSAGGSGGGAVQAATPASVAAATVPTTVPAVAPETAPEVAAEVGPTEAELASSAEQTIADWRDAWVAMDIGTYMGFYSPDFYSRYKGYDLSQWRAWKSKTFNQYQYQDVGVSGLVVQVDGLEATATFMQSFSSDSLDGGAGYQDEGEKTITMKWDGTRWLIVGEEWVSTGG